ncbi:hypothetical protein DHW03_15015 [Pedobacter yonginense]|uniref:Lantibiotic dehydratase n=1 Tax=Pedobacter yonginense TaxID=651869 RepID=A0A317EJ05_9SPHI|nr:lantibiotic dehydratase [Pedobacter yonginense]PWS26107.1 hypothetical protein DHW03_15015 [Pedobacter yonginense]
MTYESNFFLIRTPLLPFHDGLKIFDPAIDRSDYLAKIFADPLMQESIFLASSELHQQLLRYLRKELENPKKIAALEESLIEYVLRMSTRCTPFGLFAGITVGHFDKSNVIRLAPSSQSGALKRKLRLDHAVLTELVRYYDKIPAFRRKTKYMVNSSLYRVGNKYRYHEYTIINGRRNYILSEIDYLPVLARLIKQASGGISLESIVKILVADGFDQADSEAYAEELIDAQILVSEIEPTIIGTDFFDYFVGKVNAYDLENKNELNELQCLIQNINNDAAGTEIYERLSNTLRIFGLEDKKKGLFQVDLNKTAEVASLSCGVRENLFKSAQLLIALNLADLSRLNLETFKKAFIERYDRAAVSLMDVMDVENGINYKKLLEHTFPIFPTVNTRLETLKRYKGDKLKNALFKGEVVIDITDEELEKIGIFPNATDLHQSFSIMAKVLDDKGEVFQLESITGPSFAKLLGRFCNSNDELKMEVEKLAKKERELYPDQTIAEIVHLPEDRVGNVLNRPHLSTFEITYLGKSKLPLSKQIKVTDLYLRMDQHRLTLFSKKLGKEVVPRLTSAHNYVGNSLPIYHFLSEMQMQDKQGGVKWFWDEGENRSFLPRVKYKDIVLSPATWNVHLQDFLVNKNDWKNLPKIIEALPSYFIEVKIARYVYYTMQDNKLLIDTSSDFGVRYLAKKFLRGLGMNLEEALFNPQSLFVKSQKKGFTNEIIIPFVQHPNEKIRIVQSESILIPKLRREFEPGSEWVYYKIYTGAKTASQLLYKTIFPLIKQLLKENLIKQWFFIRYADPKRHLRLRLLLNDEKSLGLVFSKIYKKLNYYLKNSIITNLQVDTYTREIERYEEHTMELSEEYFFVNSNFICNIFQVLDWNDQQFKGHLAFKLIDDLLTCVYPNIRERYLFINGEVEKRGLGKVPIQKGKKEDYNKRYRSFSVSIDRFQNDFQQNLIVKKAFIQHKNFIAQNLTFLSAQKNDEPIKRIIASYIHMFANRIFEEHQNEMEGLLYFHLEKYYRSILARHKNHGINN